ncbi:hypothetical protein HMPREF9413_2621 [Paenibacillus sp. HGF7]|nr:hypothetical protein HMPREF9413_2621 [Paenibacillus sp. HGF7]
MPKSLICGFFVFSEVLPIAKNTPVSQGCLPARINGTLSIVL